MTVYNYRKFLQKNYFKQKSQDLFDQFVSMAEREIDIIWYGLLQL